MSDTHLLSGGDIELMPPIPMFLSEDLARWWLEVVPMEQAVQVIASTGTHLDQTTAVRHE